MIFDPCSFRMMILGVQDIPWVEDINNANNYIEDVKGPTDETSSIALSFVSRKDQVNEIC